MQLSHIPATIPSYPGLRQLELGPVWQEYSIRLPPPTDLPHLKHLTIGPVLVQGHETLFSSVGPYFTQLQTLSLADNGPAWFDALQGAGRSQTLTRLDVPDLYLNAYLAGWLHDNAPALDVLTVFGLRDDDYELVPAVCSWRTLRIESLQLRAYTLGWLPVPAEGKLTIEIIGHEAATLDFITDLEAPHKLKSIVLKGCDTICIDSSRVFINQDAEAHILQDMLPYLAPNCTDDRELYVKFLNYTPATIDALHEAAAAGLSKLSVCYDEPSLEALPHRPFPRLHRLLGPWAINDSSVELLARAVPEVDVWQGVRVVTETCLRRPVPARTLSVGFPVTAIIANRSLREARGCDVYEWLQDVVKCNGFSTGLKWELWELDICISMDQIANGHPKLLATVLQTAPLTYVRSVKLSPAPNTPEKEQPLLLLACLVVASALRCKIDTLSIDGWSATEAVVNMLKDLPRWETALELRLTTSYEYKTRAVQAQLRAMISAHFGHDNPEAPVHSPGARALSLVPATYHTVKVLSDGLSVGERDALVLGAPSRAPSNPLHVIVSEQRDVECARALYRRMLGTGRYRNVTLTDR